MTLADARPARVFLVDDQPLFLAGLTLALSSLAAVDIVGAAPSSLRLAHDIRLAGTDVALVAVDQGGSLIDLLLRELGSVRIIGFAEDTRDARRLAANGARGLLLRNSAGETVAQAISVVMRGGLYFQDFVRSPVIFDPHAPRARNGARLNERESEILRFVAMGLSVRQAAERLSIHVKSAETYKSRALAKLAITTRAEIVQYALLRGWLV